jgi:2-C-methyl-D-erythritol 4-phosphate cytidylyltransferase/2-C-methyl-D-erythritol 2,4-cyclodiphosphate synthase
MRRNALDNAAHGGHDSAMSSHPEVGTGVGPGAVHVLIVAAGRGVRAGDGPPKQYRWLAGLPVLTRTLQAFLASPAVSRIAVVIHPDDAALYRAAVARLDDARLSAPIPGGPSRSASVRLGLAALHAADDDLVLIHDAARPFVTPALIASAIEHGAASGACIPTLPVTDTIKRVDEDGHVVETVPRAPLRSVQTPQAFRHGRIMAAHRAADAVGRDDFTDDAALLEWRGEAVLAIAGDAANIKLTLPEDFAMAEQRLMGATETRTGTGYDVHAFGPGDHVWIGGVRIPHDHGVVAHSDGDVALHALCDALFGALADGDIGVHFPPSDPQWRGASSDRFLDFACQRLAARGGRIVHLDVSLVCEAPRIGPHREMIRERIAAIAGISADRVGLKATTSERLGFTGRREGLAALATATITLPATMAGSDVG